MYAKKLGSIAMEIMQKYVKDDGMVGIDDEDRWPIDSDSFGFLLAISETRSIGSLKEVMRSYAFVRCHDTDLFKQPLFRQKDTSVGELVLLARAVLVSARMFYSYEK